MIALLAFVAAAIDLIGMVMIGNRIRRAFLLLCVGDVIWAIVAVNTQPRLWGLFAMVAVFFVVNIRNFRKWSKA